MSGQTWKYWAVYSVKRRKWYNADQLLGEWWESYPHVALRYEDEADAVHDAHVLGPDCQAVCITVTHPALPTECPDQPEARA